MNANYKNKLCKLHPTFKDAQALFCSYSTLQSNSFLENKLNDSLDVALLNTFKTKNAREIYNKVILKYYPNEISVKSNFINQVLFKSRKHVVIFELPIGNSRADLCKINGSSTAYEIKTDLDNLIRLNKQLNDYLDIFEKVFVICSVNKLLEIESQIIPNCGIYTYSISNRGAYKFLLHRPASLSQQINCSKQLNILRKQELLKNFSVESLPIKKDLKSLILQKYSSTEINEIFKQVIKDRYQTQWDFLRNNKSQIYEIDYQWFFKNSINPALIYD